MIQQFIPEKFILIGVYSRSFAVFSVCSLFSLCGLRALCGSILPN